MTAHKVDRVVNTPRDQNEEEEQARNEKPKERTMPVVKNQEQGPAKTTDEKIPETSEKNAESSKRDPKNQATFEF